MILCCSGIPRSGSTWSYNAARLVAESTGEPVVSGFYGEGAELDAFVQDRRLEHFPGYVVLKFHQPGPYLLDLILRGDARNLLTLRDPRDCLCSRMSFEGRSFDEALLGVIGSLMAAACYEGSPSMLTLRYEALRDRPAEAVRQIAALMEVVLDENQVAALVDATSAERARALVDGLSGVEGRVAVAGRLLDPRTCLQTGHIGHGGDGRWLDELDPVERLTAAAMLRDWLVRLGYEEADALDAEIARGFAHGAPAAFARAGRAGLKSAS